MGIYYVRRVVDIGASAGPAMVSLGSWMDEAAMLVSGIGFVHGTVLEAFASILDINGTAASRKCIAKA